MNKLMKMATVVAGVGAMLSFAGCGGNTPEAVAMQTMKSFISGMDPKAAKVTTLKVEKSDVNGDSGIVHIGVYENGKKGHVEKVEVRKVNGKWEVE